MRTEAEHKDQVNKAREVIKEAYNCVIEQIALTDFNLPVELDFTIRVSGIGVNVNVFEYDI